MTLVARAALLVSFPVAAAIVGSLVALIRRPGPRLVSGIQHFAAGVVMAALVGEVMPDLRREGQLPWAVGGFVIGVAVVLSLGAWGRRLESRDRTVARSVGYVLPIGLLVAVGIDLVLDGLLVGLGVTLGSSAGLILTIALTIEILFLSLSVVGELIDTGGTEATRCDDLYRIGVSHCGRRDRRRGSSWRCPGYRVGCGPRLRFGRVALSRCRGVAR